MKVDAKAFKYDVLSKESSLAILPLVPKEFKYLKSETATFKCRTSPREDTSPTYEIVVKIIDGSESLREVLTWTRQINTLVEGLNLDNGSKIVNVIRKVVKGQAETIFNNNLESMQNNDRAGRATKAYNETQGDEAAKKAAADAIRAAAVNAPDAT